MISKERLDALARNLAEIILEDGNHDGGEEDKKESL